MDYAQKIDSVLSELGIRINKTEEETATTEGDVEMNELTSANKNGNVKEVEEEDAFEVTEESVFLKSTE